MSLTTELRPLADAPSVAIREAWGNTLVALAADYPDLVVFDGDLANSTRADIFAAAVPDRFFEMGIAEQNLLGVAAGMATCGFVPWISTFTAFLTSRALDQIRVVIAQPHLNVKMCGSYSGILTGKTGKTHQSVDDLAVFRAMPGVSVIAPADANELAAAMRLMMETDGPQYLRLTRDPSPVVFPKNHEFRLGKAELLRIGGDIGLIGTGTQTIRVLEAADLLAARGIEAAVLHIPTLKPLDVDAIVALAERVDRIVTAEDHSIIGGLGGAVAECLGEHRPTRIRRIGIRDVFGESAANDALLEKYGLTAAHVADAAVSLLDGEQS
jgi:transketolase